MGFPISKILSLTTVPDGCCIGRVLDFDNLDTTEALEWLACEYNLPKLDKVDEDFIFRRLWPEEGGDDEDEELISPAVEGREGGDEAYREEDEDGVICDGVATVFPIKWISVLVKDR